MPDTPATVGFVGFREKVGERVLGAEREEGDKEMWCSGGAQGIVQGEDREDPGSFRCSWRAGASLQCSVGP